MAIVNVNGGPRYTYEQPSEKPMVGMPADHGIQIENYRLPAIDVQERMRNFNGYQVNQYYTMEEVVQGDTSGTTETDSITDPRGDPKGYTRINHKSGTKSQWK